MADSDDIQDIDDSEDDDLETPSSAGSDADESDSPAPTSTPMNPQLAAYLQQAQKKAATNQLIAGLARAGGTLSRGYGQVTAADDSAYNALDQSAQDPVNKLLQTQKAQAADVANQSNALALQKQEDSSDPSSPQSKAVQGMIQKLYPGKFTPDQLASVSAADAESLIYKPLELDEKVKAAAKSRADSLESKSDDKQDKAYTAMRKDLESFRGNQAVQQAALAIQNSDKALALVQSQPTQQNLALLADEMGKIATGGVPGEHGTAALMPNNLATKVAELKAFVLSKPSSADVSEYLQNNADYLKQVRDISAKSLTSYRTNIAKGYKNRVAPDDYQQAVDDYGLGGSSPTPAGSAADVPAAAPPQAPAVARKTKDGRTALFDPNTKQFLRYQ